MPHERLYSPLSAYCAFAGSTAVGAYVLCCDIWYSIVYVICSRLSVQRLRTLQQKKEAQAKASRRDIATLLERSKVETARVKVENSQYIGVASPRLSPTLSRVCQSSMKISTLNCLSCWSCIASCLSPDSVCSINRQCHPIRSVLP